MSSEKICGLLICIYITDTHCKQSKYLNISFCRCTARFLKLTGLAVAVRLQQLNRIHNSSVLIRDGILLRTYSVIYHGNNELAQIEYCQIIIFSLLIL